jgi:hypothetical protein
MYKSNRPKTPGKTKKQPTSDGKSKAKPSVGVKYKTSVIYKKK